MGVVTTVLCILGYVLLSVLVLVLVLVMLVLFVPARFQAHGRFSLLPPADDGQPAEGDRFWLELLGLLEERGPEPAGDLRPAFEGALSGRLTWMGGALVVDPRGVRVFGRRVGGRRRKALREATAPQETAAPQASTAPTAGRAIGRTVSPGRRPEAGDRRRPRTTGGRRLDLATALQLLRPALTALHRSWSAFRLRLAVRITFGTGDPAGTGLIAGRAAALVYPFARAANAKRPGSFDFQLRPVFSGEELSAGFNLSGGATVFGLVRPIAGFALRRDVRRLWWPRRGRRAGTAADQSREKEAA